MKITEIIKKTAFDLLEAQPEGIRYSELINLISTQNPSFNKNTISGAIWNLDQQFPEKIYKADRGIFRLLKYNEEVEPEIDEKLKKKTPKGQLVCEGDFYKPFADWLVNEIEECTKAIPLGGNLFKDKWGTPDVIGIRESKRSDIIEFPTEIVSAEIKLDSNGLITAFGQACAYKIFSHKSYIGRL